ncbi:MAG: DUF2892 domain-containing protein [Bacteroidota bacterium]
MKKNIGNTDRTLRLLAALLIAVLYFTDQISGLAAIVLGGLAFIFTMTSCIGTCPLYLPFNISTKKKEL